MDLIRQYLETLDIADPSEWDLLVFVYRHGTSLASAEQIARFLGYRRAEVGAALDSLTSKGLLQRSRNSHGVRLYRLTALITAESALNADKKNSWEKLMKVIEEREGRLLIVKHLRQGITGKELRARGGLHLA